MFLNIKHAIALLYLSVLSAQALEYDISRNGIRFMLDNDVVLQSNSKGLWAIAQDWQGGKPSDFVYANPSKIEILKNCSVAFGEAKTNTGVWRFKDVYSKHKNMIKCVRRYEYRGENAPKISLQNEFEIPVKTEKLLVPAVVYYGNPSGYKHGKERVPTFSEKDSPDVLFEEHRLPMPFACAEFPIGDKTYSVALHTIPSKAQCGNIPDQWWTLGASLRKNSTALISSSGAVAYNNEWGRIKSLQRASHKYPDTYLNIKDGTIIQKIFYISADKCDNEGSGFMQAVDASLEIFEPYSTAGMPAYKDIVKSKYEFSRTRYIEGKEHAGFLFYPNTNDAKKPKCVVFGWCGQAAAPGYAYQHLQKFGDADEMRGRVQKSLDFLSGSPFGENGFKLKYNIDSGEWSQEDYLSQAQGLQNMLMAINSAKSNDLKSGNAPEKAPELTGELSSPPLSSGQIGGKKTKGANMLLNTSKWEMFARKACNFHADRILKNDWHSLSTNEAFFAAPFALGYKIFGDEKFKSACIKVADTFAKRHINMREVYWGGTLDAIGEDKEGAWAAFQAFLSAYDITKDAKYIDYAKHAAYITLTYTVVWKIDMPPSRLCDAGFNSVGWTSVSPQNEHLDVYGVLYTPQLYRLGNILNDGRLVKLSEVMFRTCGQLIDEHGSQGEQIQHTNFAQYKVDINDDVFSFRGGYAENWTVFWITAHFLNAAAQFAELDAPFAK